MCSFVHLQPPQTSPKLEAKRSGQVQRTGSSLKRTGSAAKMQPEGGVSAKPSSGSVTTEQKSKSAESKTDAKGTCVRIQENFSRETTRFVRKIMAF